MSKVRGMPYRSNPRQAAIEKLEPRRLLSAAFTNINITRMKGNQAEGAIAVDPADPSHLFTATNIDKGDGIAVAVSSDGGATWTTRTIANDHDSLPPACCDPSVAFDSSGNLFVAYLNSADNEVELLLSTDAGQSFSLLAHYSGNVDQPTVTTGAGSVWLDFDKGNGVAVTGAPVTGLGSIGSFDPLQQVRGSNGGSFGDIAVGSSGQVMVTYQKDVSSQRSQVFVNVDPTGIGGAFGKSVLVTNTNVVKFDFIPAQNSRGIDAEAGLTFDRSGGQFDGRVYLVYTDEIPAASGNTGIFVRYSDNNGASWSSAIRVNDDTGTNSKLLPRISSDPVTGAVAVSWYDARNDLGAGSSGDTDQIADDDAEFFATVITPQQDGLIVVVNQQISAAPSNAFDANSSTDFGDYTGLDFFNGTLHPLWFDNSNSTGDNPNGTLNQLNAYTASVPASAFASGPAISLGGLSESSGPVASLYTASGSNPGFVRSGKSYTLTVLYSDPAGVALSSLSSSNIEITGPNGFDEPAQLLRAKPRKGGTELVTYVVSSPSGRWTAADSGTYTIALQPSQVTGTDGAPAASGILGDFVVATAIGANSHGGGNGNRHHARHADD
jgi:hypothetical protein